RLMQHFYSFINSRSQHRPIAKCILISHLGRFLAGSKHGILYLVDPAAANERGEGIGRGACYLQLGTGHKGSYVCSYSTPPQSWGLLTGAGDGSVTLWRWEKKADF